MTPSTLPPTIETATQQAAQRTPSTASIRILRCPSDSLAIGSCASTITTVLTKKIIPMALSETSTSFFANTGRSSKPDMPAKMNRVLSPTTATNGPCRNTST